jgi:uncharacterized protein
MIPRKDCPDLVRQAANHAVSILIGSRQVGKSTLMQMIRETLDAPAEQYNLENPLHLALFNEGYTSFRRQIREKLIFIDEFQYCKGISSVFKAVYDMNPEIKIYASGSSSLEIQTHLHESLAGRKRETIIYPLSFPEWLLSVDASLAAIAPIDAVSRIDDLEEYRKHLENFIRFGALPRLTSMRDELEKREYLFGIYQTYIAKDIKSFLLDESVLSFNKMLSWLALNNGALLNKNTLATVAGVSSRQIDRYLEVLQGTFVVSLVPPLSSNKRKELVKTNKFYFYDQGVVNSIIQDFRPVALRPDAGMLRETLVFWELKKHLDIRYNLKYWRTADGKEVDFVLEKDRQLLPIEVKSSWKPGKIPSGLANFFRFYPETRIGVVLYDGAETTSNYDGRSVYFAPIYKAGKVLDLI